MIYWYCILLYTFWKSWMLKLCVSLSIAIGNPSWRRAEICRIGSVVTDMHRLLVINLFVFSRWAFIFSRRTLILIVRQNTASNKKRHMREKTCHSAGRPGVGHHNFHRQSRYEGPSAWRTCSLRVSSNKVTPAKSHNWLVPTSAGNFTLTDGTKQRTVTDRIIEGESNKENQLSGK